MTSEAIRILFGIFLHSTFNQIGPILIGRSEFKLTDIVLGVQKHKTYSIRIHIHIHFYFYFFKHIF